MSGPSESPSARDQRLNIGAVVVAAILAVVAGEVGRWIAAGLVLWVAPPLLGPLARLPALRRLRPQLPLLLLGLLSLWLLGDLLMGRPPATRDHGVHYFQTHLLADQLIPAGQLTGWSNDLNNGYPFGDSYPVLSYLWVAAFHLVSFGLISLRISYAWGMLAVWGVCLWGIWRLAALIAREVVRFGGGSAAARISPAWAAAIAAGLWLIDPGYSREGGWHYVMFHGVWPQLLSTGLWIASLSLTWEAFGHPSPRRIALAGLFVAGAILAHPFGMLTVACSAVMWPVVLQATRATDELPPGVYRVWLVLHVVGALVSLGWVVAFLASANYMGRTPVPGEPLGALVAELVTGELFERHRAFTGPLAVVGIVLVFRSGRAVAWLSVAGLFAMLVASSEAAITVLRLDLILSSFKNLQFPRYALALKPLWFALAGLGGALLVSVLARRPARPRPRASWARLAACLVIGPLLVGLVDDFSRLVPRPANSVMPLEASRYEGEEAALTGALVAEGAGLPESRPLTVAFLRRGMSGGTYPLFSIADANARVILDGHVPSVNFRYRVNRRGVSVLRSLGVTHVVHDRPLDGEDTGLEEVTEVVGVYGAYSLRRLLPEEDGDGARALFVRPESNAIVESWERERIVIELPEAEPNDRVELTLAPYRKWVVRTEGGEVLTPSGDKVLSGLAGLGFRVPGPGRYTISYEKLPREHIAAWISIVALLLVALALTRGKPITMAQRIHSPLALRVSLGLTIASVAIVVALGLVRQRKLMAESWQPIMDHHNRTRRLSDGVPRNFDRDLVAARDYRVITEPGTSCDGMRTKDSMPGCSTASQRPRVSIEYRSPFLYRCVRFVVPPRGSVEVVVADLAADEAVFGFFKRAGRGRGGDQLRWTVNGHDELQAARSSRRHFHVQPEQHTGTFALRLENDNDLHEEVCASIASAR